jgi:hypothetical protein
METFKIEVQEFLARVVEIEADNLEEALTNVQNRYKKSEIVLDYNDFVDAVFIDLNSQTKSDEMKMLIKEVIEYLYDDEKKHYEESEEPKDHIHIKIERLKELVN